MMSLPAWIAAEPLSIRLALMGKHWLAVVFVLLALLSAVALWLLATGRLRVGSEWPALLVGAVLLAVLLAAVRR
jgi:hypothetical protein